MVVGSTERRDGAVASLRRRGALGCVAGERSRRRAPSGRHRPRRRRQSTGWRSQVPGHWRAHPELADSDGPILYRRRFELAAPSPGARRWITFDGIFYQADVWLDGAYLGDPEGYFFPHSFDVTALSPPRRRPRAGGRGDVQPRARHARPAQHHRPVPALRSRRPAMEPGRAVAAGARLRHRAGEAGPPPRAVPRRRRDPRPPAPRRPPRQRRRPHGAGAHDRRRHGGR